MGISSVAARPSRRVRVKARRCLTALVAGAAAVAGSLVSLPSAGAAPANNNFASATLLTGTSGSFSGTTVGGNLESGEWVSSVWDSGHSSVWYKFVPPSNGELRIDVSCPASGFTTIHIDENLAAASDYGFVAGGYCTGGTYPASLSGSAIVRAGSVYHVEIVSGVSSGDDGRGPFSGTFSFTAMGTPGAFAPVTPTRILDTRPSSAVGAGATKTLRVAGVAGVPSNATAVALNITTTRTSAAGYLTAWPTAKPRPTASAMNWKAGATTAAMSIVTVGSSGSVNLFNSAGTTHVIVDVAGYFSGGAAGGLESPTNPVRLLDTRAGNGLSGVFTEGQTRDLQITGRGGVPSNATAVVMNLTTTASTAGGFVTAWPTGIARPVASVLNRSTGQTIANLAIIPIGAGGKISLFNNVGNTHLIGDLQGYFTPDSPIRYQPITPRRLTDTRVDFSGCCPLEPNDSTFLALDRPEMEPPAGSTDWSVTVTGINPSVGTFFTVYGELERPIASNLNLAKGEVRANAAIGAAPYGSLKVFNNAGLTHVASDLNGYFWDPLNTEFPAAGNLPQADHSAEHAARDVDLLRNVAQDREEGRVAVPLRPPTEG